VSSDPNETVPVLIKMRAELLEAMDASLAPLGYQDRSRFVRDAIVEKARLSPALALMTSRKGVGGTPSHKRALSRHAPFPVTTPDPADVTMNDGPASSGDALARLHDILHGARVPGTPGTDDKAPGAPEPPPPRAPKRPRPPSTRRG
jgi:hypothetical protein